LCAWFTAKGAEFIMADFTGTSGTSLTVLPQSYCRRLRCKEMFVDTGIPFHPAQSGSGIYWCNYTQNCLGPDDETSGIENCQPGRACFEEL
jgi:hypothetical protein